MTEKEITEKESADAAARAAELVDLARRVRAYQDSQSWSDARLIREFKEVRSARSYADFRNGRTEGYDLAARLEDYRAACSRIDSESSDRALAPVYEDLSAVRAVRLAATAAMASWGTNRVVLAYGDSGIGKSYALRALRRNYGSRVVVVEAASVWDDRPCEFLGALDLALGDDGLPPTSSARLARVRARLSRGRRLVAVDEAQHLGPRCLAAVKNLVNTTPGEFALVGLQTLGGRMATDAYIEARQLATNRLSSCVRLVLRASDIQAYLAHSFPAAPRDVLRQAAAAIRPAAESNGNLAFVRDVAATAAEMLAADEKSPSVKTFVEAVKSVSDRRSGSDGRERL